MSAAAVAQCGTGTSKGQKQQQRKKAGKAHETPNLKITEVGSSKAGTKTKEPCKFFLKGNCRYGAGCRNSHEKQEMGETVTDAELQRSLARTVMFQAVQSKLSQSSNAPAAVAIPLNNGSTRPANNLTTPTGGGPGPAVSNSAQKTSQSQQKKICFKWKKGKCTEGSSCRYLHDRAPSSINRSSNESGVVGRAAIAAQEAQKLQEERKSARLAEKAAANERDAAVVSQHILLKSSIVTCGAGMDIRGVICGFDTKKVLIHGFPNSTSPEAALQIFSQRGISKDLVLIRNAFTPRGSTTKSFEVVLAMDDAAAVVLGLDGQKCGKNTLRFEYSNEAIPTDAMKQNEDRKNALLVTWNMPLLTLDTEPSVDEIVEAIKEHVVDLCGSDFLDIRLLSGRASTKVLASVRFTDLESAKDTLAILRNRRLRPAHPILRAFIPDPIHFMLVVPLKQYRAQKTQWDTLVADNNKDGVHIEVREDARTERARVDVRGKDVKPIGALKVRVETLAAGDQLGPTHYHHSFSRAGGRPFLENVCSTTGAFVRYDFRVKALRLYGDTKSQEAARRMISAEVDRLGNLERKIYLERQSLRFFIRKGLPTLKEMLGEDAVKLDVASCQLTLRGGDNANNALDKLIEQSKDPNALISDTTGKEICPVCYTPASTPFPLACDHVYCVACLQHYLTSAADMKQFPLTCLGDDAKCKLAIPIPVIQRFLTKQQYDQLASVAFLTYLEQHPKEFRYCTTPDCDQIYKCNSGKSLECPSCFSKICSQCNQEEHEGMTCKERQQRKDQEKDYFEDSAWLAELGIKRCPSCRSHIQKTEGCNRMKCKCGAHFCWICTQSFDGMRATYAHLRDEHGESNWGCIVM